jgi:hypothetical protein
VFGSAARVGATPGDRGVDPRRQARLRRRHGRLVGLLESLSAASRHDGRGATEAESGERARLLERLLAGSGVRLLNDRQVPGGRARVDHLAVGPQGVTVIHATHEAGRARVVDGRLLVDDHDRTALVNDLIRQVAVIRLGLATSPDIPVAGAICWAGPNGLPRLRKLSVNGVLIDGPRALAEELRRPGPVSAKRMRRLADVLDRRLPPRAIE